MNLLIFTQEKFFIKIAKFAFLISLFQITLISQAQWKVDLSRRIKADRTPQSEKSQIKGEDSSTIFEWLTDLDEGVGIQELVVLNTPSGFVPNTLRVKEGGQYRIHVVNVNESEKNISFVMDAFSQHHATYFGKIKSFNLTPKKEGVYSFVCPETSALGKLVVHKSLRSQSIRNPASEN